MSDYVIGESAECADDGKHNDCGKQITRSDLAENIERVGRAFDFSAVSVGIFENFLNNLIRLEIENIVNNKKCKRNDNGYYALVFQFRVNFCNHPAERAGDYHNYQRNDNDKQHRADDRGRPERNIAEINNDCRNNNKRGIERTHDINSEQS